MNYDDQLDYEYAIHCLKIENNRLLRAVRRFEMSDNIDEGCVGGYFRKLVAIETTICDLHKGSGLSKDVRAIKAMKRVENIMKDFDEQKPQDISIDEGCVGCAGPCKVVDVSANLQKELDSAMVKLTDSRNHCGYLSKIIDDFKTIETRETDRLHKTIDDHKETIHIDRTNRAAEKELINRKYREDLRKKNATIEELKDQNIKDLKELYGIYERELDRFKHIISERDITIDGLEAELSARKDDKTTVFEVEYPVDRSRTIHLQKMRIDEQKQTIEELKADSAVLMKVVEIVKRDDNCPTIVNQLADLLVDYIGAPEPIDEDQDIAIVFTYGEIL